jgi:hypothetical protein
MEWPVRSVSLRALSIVAGILSLLVAGCDNRSATAKDTTVVVQPSDLKPTRLTSAERQGFAAECRKAYDTGDPKSARDLARICDCHVDQLEDRTTKLEFLMAIEIMRVANSAMGEPNLRPLEAGASKIGVTPARLQEISLDARKANSNSIRSCVERVTSSQ